MSDKSVSMKFEYDGWKSESNLAKHGIDFEEAQELWLDANRIEYDLRYGGEDRFAVVGRLKDGCWTAVCTLRGENTRIISVRRSTHEEVSLYDKTNNDR